jgi:effector-binding domain-containing protein
MQVIKMPGQMWAFLSQHSGLDGKDINAAVAGAFDQLTEKIARAGVRTQGPPCAHYRYRDGEQVGFDIGFPIDPQDEGAARKAGLGTGETLSGDALMHIHRGPYARLGEIYRRMERDLSSKGLKGRGDLWELYLNDPDACPAGELLTQVLWPVESAIRA